VEQVAASVDAGSAQGGDFAAEAACRAAEAFLEVLAPDRLLADEPCDEPCASRDMVITWLLRAGRVRGERRRCAEYAIRHFDALYIGVTGSVGVLAPIGPLCCW